MAQFCDSPLADQCDLSLTQTLDAEQAQISADPALLGRLVENLLSNSVRHNPQPAVLAALKEPESSEDAPHILGLHVVEQIAAAHGGTAVFEQSHPHGARAVIRLPLGELARSA